MKTILLTSSGKFITKNKLEFLPKPIKQMKIAWVTTAGNRVDDTTYLKEHEKKMIELGYDFEKVDVAGKDEKEVREMLKDKEIILVEGGNTFYLLKATRESGFDKVVKELVAKGVIYIGSSAGSYLACPTIEMATWKPQNKFDRCGVTDFKALDLVPFLVLAHYIPEYEDLVKEKMKTTQYPVKLIVEEQAILIRDDKVEFIGKGKEIKI